MYRPTLGIAVGMVLAALAFGAHATTTGQAQVAPPEGSAATPTATAASPARAKAPVRKRLQLRKTRRVVTPGVTGGTPEASARTPGGPPPGTPNGLTFPIPPTKK